MATNGLGLLLINLGTPASPAPRDVRRYLREFLLDPRVIDLAAWKRQSIVRLFVLPFRPRRSAEAYRQIWTDQGSPLLLHGRALAAKIQQQLGERVQVELAMRYGEPSIAAALERLRRQGIDRIVAFPLYPQYASSTTGSTVEALLRAAAGRWNTPFLQIVPPFYDHPAYIAALAAVGRPVLERVRPERVIFSFHGLPQRHCRRSDESASHCFVRADCCDQIVAANRYCYRAQCMATARLLAARLGVPAEQRRISFQSRLGRDPWLEPETDEVVVGLAREGVKRAVILSPSFVADCLETLEELGLRAAERFAAHGGQQLELVPSLNAETAWVEAVVRIASESSGWLRS
jgi:ferrochelatase